MRENLSRTSLSSIVYFDKRAEYQQNLNCFRRCWNEKSTTLYGVMKRAQRQQDANRVGKLLIRKGLKVSKMLTAFIYVWENKSRRAGGNLKNRSTTRVVNKY